MSKKHPFFSPLSCGIALLLLLALAGILIVIGGGMFSPGPLTAAHSRNRPLQGFSSHADFEDECSRCHTPLFGAVAGRCLACHTTINDQVRANTGLHGVLAGVNNCVACHSDHLGRETRITHLDTFDFPHQEATGFTLLQHQTDYDGLSLECVDCHAGASYNFDRAACVDCHTPAQPTFMAEHLAAFSDDCLACHDGSGRTGSFDHAAFFPLEDAHATIDCIDCHMAAQFKNTPRDCYGCHAADDAHNGQLGTDCVPCHTPVAWEQAALEDHIFPLTHKNGGRPIECQVCHPSTYSAYTCYDCHEHRPAEIEHKHREEGIADFQLCASCHPTGREYKGDEDKDERHEREREDDEDDGHEDDGRPKHEDDEDDEHEDDND